MKCSKCQGRVFVDRVFNSDTRSELFCLMCGKRWMIKNDKNGFSSWLYKKEKELAKISGGTTFI
jgi:hypothetical protein